MKPLKLVFYPDSKLRRKSIPIIKDRHLPQIAKLFEHMDRTIKFFQIKSLSAPQIGVGFRAVAFLRDGVPFHLINPKILKSDGKMEMEEVCASLPHFHGYVSRNSEIEVEFADLNGDTKRETFVGEEAGIIQHEIEHLDGILFIDKVSKLKRDMMMKRLKKLGKI